MMMIMNFFICFCSPEEKSYPAKKVEPEK